MNERSHTATTQWSLNPGRWAVGEAAWDIGRGTVREARLIGGYVASNPGEALSEAGSGLKTGTKAVGNATVNTVTFGFVNEAMPVTAADRAAGYNIAVGFASVATETTVGLATGGLAKSGGFVARTAFAADVTQNIFTTGRGGIDIYQNGLNWQNGLQTAAGGLGLTGNAVGAMRHGLRIKL